MTAAQLGRLIEKDGVSVMEDKKRQSLVLRLSGACPLHSSTIRRNLVLELI